MSLWGILAGRKEFVGLITLLRTEDEWQFGIPNSNTCGGSAPS